MQSYISNYYIKAIAMQTYIDAVSSVEKLINHIDAALVLMNLSLDVQHLHECRRALVWFKYRYMHCAQYCYYHRLPMPVLNYTIEQDVLKLTWECSAVGSHRHKVHPVLIKVHGVPRIVPELQSAPLVIPSPSS